MKEKIAKSSADAESRPISSLVWFLVGAAILLALAGTGLFFSGNKLFFQNRHFTFRILDLQENGPGYWGKRYAELSTIAGIRPGTDNLWKINPADVRTRILQIPAIASCEVRRVLPDTLQVVISERMPRAAIERPDSPRVLADDCMVLNRFESFPTAGVLPVISGIGLRRVPAPGSRCPSATAALQLLNECLQNYPDISVLYVNIAKAGRLDCTVRYRNRRVYRAIIPVGQRYDYLMAALQSAIIDVLKNNDRRTTFDLTYRGQVVIR